MSHSKPFFGDTFVPELIKVKDFSVDLRGNIEGLLISFEKEIKLGLVS
jgi:hypothetical protein